MRIWGKPSEFKGIKIYPVQMINIEPFYENISCLMYEKNKINDARIIKLTYLDFLFLLIREQEHVFEMVTKLFDLVFRDQEYKFKFQDDGTIHLVVDDVEISGYEFDFVRNLIMETNGIQNEEILDSEMELEMRKLEELKNKEQGNPATLEERIVTYHCLSGIDYERIEKYTVFQFIKGLERFAIIKNFDVYSALLAENGASKDIVHFLSHIEEKGRFDSLAMSEEEFNRVTSIG